jgi:hypothetical protein
MNRARSTMAEDGRHGPRYSAARAVARHSDVEYERRAVTSTRHWNVELRRRLVILALFTAFLAGCGSSIPAGMGGLKG